MPCVSAECRYYSKVLPPSGTKDAAILDMCSSWVSHYPKGYKLSKISGEYINIEIRCALHAQMENVHLFMTASGDALNATARLDNELRV